MKYAMVLIALTILFFFVTVKEGLDFPDTDMPSSTKPKVAVYEAYKDDPLILGKLNAGNIEFLKTRMDQLQGSSSGLSTIESKVNLLQLQVQTLLKQQAGLVTSLNA